MATVYGPTVPYNVFLNSQFVPGTRIEINGTVKQYGNSFAVNLKTASGAILLHLNPRFNERVLVLNTNRTGTWEQEVRPPVFPFNQGRPFSLHLICEASGISVVVDSSPVANFAHRGAYQEIKLVEITGDVEVQLFREHPAAAFPVGFAAPMMQPSFPGAYGAPMNQALPMPYQAAIIGGMQLGRQVVITGTATGERFEVNLRCGNYQGSDIALHFNPRFNEGTIVRNSCINNGWGTEERHGGIPAGFQQGAPFTIQIVCEYNGFKVFVNGMPYSDFRHRIHPSQRVDTVQISGSVAVSSCNC